MGNGHSIEWISKSLVDISREHDLTQSELGRLLGVHYNTIGKLEKCEGMVGIWIKMIEALDHKIILVPREKSVIVGDVYAGEEE